MSKSMDFSDVGEGLTEGEVLEIHVEKGDSIEVDDVIMEVHTDKARVDIPSNFDGVVTEIPVEEGEIVNVGDPLVYYEQGNGASESGGSKDIEKEKESNESKDKQEDDNKKPSEEERDDSGSIIGTNISDKEETDAKTTNKETSREDKVEEDEKVEKVDTNKSEGFVGISSDALRLANLFGYDVEKLKEEVLENDERKITVEDVRESDQTRNMTSKRKDSGNSKALATPAARKLAKDKGVDISVVAKGTIDDKGNEFTSVNDVKNFLESTSEKASATHEQEDKITETLDYSGIRKGIGDHMVKSYSEKPHVHHQDWVDATELVNLKENLNKFDKNITLTPLLVKICSLCLENHRIFNSRLNEEEEEIVLEDNINVGVATNTNNGLMVPVVDNVTEKTVSEINKEIIELSEKCRNGDISRSEMQGSTFSVTNIGVIGGEYSTPIINGDNSAIIAFGEIRGDIKPYGDKAIRIQKLPISLAFDHRIADGAEAAEFVNEIKEYVQNPEVIIL